MKMIPDRFKYNGLFSIMFFTTVIIIIIVSVTITWITTNMSQKFFIEKFSLNNTKIMDKIQENFDSYDYLVVKASINLLESESVKSVLEKKESDVEKMNSYFNIGQKINYLQSTFSPNQIGIIVMDKNGIVYGGDSIYWPINYEKLKNSTITRNSLKEPERLIYQFDNQLTNNPSREENEKYIVASRALIDSISRKIYGTAYFAIPENQFSNFYSSYTDLGNNVFLIDKQGVIVSSNTKNLVGQRDNGLLRYAKEMENHPNKYMINSFMGKDQIILVNYLPYLDMYLINMIDEQTAIGDLIDKKEITLIVIGIVAVALIAVFLAAMSVTNSLSRLVRQIGNAAKNDFHQYVSVTGTYETRQIGRAFNSMLDELHEYVDKLVLAQKQQRNAELAALQQQINPHFLYNTLTSIKFLVLQGEKEETENTINALISLLQNTIGNVKETVTVEQELDNVRNYVFINQKRFGNRIKVNYFVAPDCRGCRIPKLILQPFVENSFFHGFNKKTAGYIHILIWREGDRLLCEVSDNGDGIELNTKGKFPNTKRKQQFFSGIGIKNVHERIQLIYGEQYGVTISGEIGEGTKVRLVLPVNDQ